MKISNKQQIFKWWNSVSRSVRNATYIEVFRESGGGPIYLMVNTVDKPTCIMRVGRRFSKWFVLEPIKSEYLNINRYRVLEKRSTDAELIENGAVSGR